MTVQRLASALDRFGLAVGALSCLVLFLLLIADIVLRKLGVTFLWSIEYSSFLMAFIVFFPLAAATRRRHHLTADFFLDLTGPAFAGFMRRWTIPLVMFGFSVVLLYLAAEITWTSWQDEARSTGPLRTPMAIPQAGMVVALAAMTLCALLDVVAPQPAAERGPA